MNILSNLFFLAIILSALVYCAGAALSMWQAGFRWFAGVFALAAVLLIEWAVMGAMMEGYVRARYFDTLIAVMAYTFLILAFCAVIATLTAIVGWLRKKIDPSSSPPLTASDASEPRPIANRPKVSRRHHPR
ncbi:MAG TPA: hypothetical protein VK669_01730 [Candidatus Limnocylindrales bacterium]|nr:hypothetical protein [Candidatus Limnocylindrales bacterium]